VGSGAKLTDSATLAGGSNPGGFIAFALTDPNGATVDSEVVSVIGNGTYSTPNGYLPSATGTYQWVASYSGDSNNNAVASAPDNEAEVVSKASPTLTTNPSATALTLGSTTATLKDTATLAGGYGPGGSLIFTLFYNSGSTPVDTETVTVNGNGKYTTPTGYTLQNTGTVVGTYQWDVSYIGDSNNNGVNDTNSTSEQVAVSKAAPTLAATPGGTVALDSGNKLVESATLAGGYVPGGYTVFTLTDPHGATVDTEVVTVSGNGTYSTPNGYLPLTSGTYQWLAVDYSGDGNNNAVTSAGGSQPEFVNGTNTPTLSSTAGGSVVLGSGNKLTDSALLTGSSSPAGSITFRLMAPDGVTVLDTEAVTVNGNGTYSTPSGYLPTATGTYRWVASYSGDSNNTSATSTTSEVVNAASPTLTTSPSATSVTLSTTAPTLKDTATVASGYSPSGTITFTLFYNGGSTAVDTEQVTVNGNGTYTTPTGLTLPTTGAVTGTYQWDAAYSGDTNNNAVSDNNNAGEQVTVSPVTPTLTTSPSATSVSLGSTTPPSSSPTLKDTATLAGGYFETGTLTFNLYQGSNQVAVDTERVTVTKGNSAYTTPTGYTLPTSGTVTGTYQWNVSYTGDGNNIAVSDNNSFSEQVVVSPAVPTLTSTPGATTVVLGSGTNLTDSGTLSGSFNPIGTITFTLLAPDGKKVDTETITVSGRGPFTTPTGYALPTVATDTLIGTYQWNASYSGDANNNPVSVTGAASEQVAVTPAITTLTATPGAAVLVGSGAKMSVSAALAGGVSPGGTILFTLTAPNGSTVDQEIVAVNGNATYSTPTGYAPKTPGTYQWVASYSGDANNAAVSTTSGSASEQANAPHTPTLTTKPGAVVTVGSTGKLTDSATLAGGASPTGTITFYLFAPGVTPDATNSNHVYSDMVTVKGVGTYTTATVTGTKPGGYLPSGTGTLTGSYQWVVSYSGDNNNNAVSVTTGTENVNAVTPKISVSASNTVLIGSSLTASATLSGAYNPGGSILFTLAAPDGSIVHSETIAVTANTTYQTKGYTPPAATLPGTYQWTASYSGDGNNNGVTTKSGAAPQKLVAANTPKLTSKPGGTVVAGSGARLTDSVTLSGGASPGGTITFYLFAPGVTPNATNSNHVYSVAVTVSGAGTYSTPTGYLPTRAGTYKWVASYSGDTNNNPVSSIALEAVQPSSRWGRA
jgi:hypothetical protein